MVRTRGKKNLEETQSSLEKKKSALNASFAKLKDENKSDNADEDILAFNEQVNENMQIILTYIEENEIALQEVNNDVQTSGKNYQEALKQIRELELKINTSEKELEKRCQKRDFERRDNCNEASRGVELINTKIQQLTTDVNDIKTYAENISADADKLRNYMSQGITPETAMDESAVELMIQKYLEQYDKQRNLRENSQIKSLEERIVFLEGANKHLLSKLTKAENSNKSHSTLIAEMQDVIIEQDQQLSDLRKFKLNTENEIDILQSRLSTHELSVDKHSEQLRDLMRMTKNVKDHEIENEQKIDLFKSQINKDNEKSIVTRNNSIRWSDEEIRGRRASTRRLSNSSRSPSPIRPIKDRLRENATKPSLTLSPDRSMKENQSFFDTSRSAFRREKMSAPIFKAESSEKPMKFIREIKRYMGSDDWPLDDVKYILARSLRGTAGSWWDMIENSISSFDQFEREFKQRFWNSDITDQIKRKIEYGTYSETESKTRVEYTTELMSQAVDIGEMSEKELVRKLADHHGFDVRFAVSTQKIETKSALLDLLSCKDNGKKREKESQRIMTEKTSNSNSNSSSAGQNQRNFKSWNNNQRFNNNNNSSNNQNSQNKTGESSETYKNQAQSGKDSTNKKSSDGQNSFKKNPPKNTGTKSKNGLDVYALDREIEKNPLEACGFSKN